MHLSTAVSLRPGGPMSLLKIVSLIFSLIFRFPMRERSRREFVNGSVCRPERQIPRHHMGRIDMCVVDEADNSRRQWEFSLGPSRANLPSPQTWSSLDPHPCGRHHAKETLKSRIFNQDSLNVMESLAKRFFCQDCSTHFINPLHESILLPR